MSVDSGHGALMDNVYRRQRHLYDATRKFYLLGRDPMIAGLNVPPGGSVLEIGCGTGRNLVKLAERYRDAEIHGIDISREMLTTAGGSVAKRRLQGRVRLALADAALFDPLRTFGRDSFDRIVISYAVSMIPAWQAVMQQAVKHLKPGGELHIVDFGDLKALPRGFKTALYRWLAAFHVTPRHDLFRVAADVASACGGVSEARRLSRGFAWISIIRR